MDFFAHQDQARRSTGRLVLLFFLAVGLTIFSAYAAIAAILFHDDWDRWWQPQVFALIAGSTAALVALGAMFKTFSLRSGGAAVAEMLGGRRVLPATTDTGERRLHNVVEEMAIAAGMPVPQVFILEEDGLNAFAAGFGPGDAVVAVTRGAVQNFTREELQGVVGHEFSHIFHGDMRLNLRLMGWIGGLLVLSTTGRVLLESSRYSARSSRDRKGGGNPVALIGLSLFITGLIGLFFSRLIKAAVSRQREFLADAASAQYTRNPAGLAGALAKITELAAGSKIQHPQAEEASHLFFANALAPTFLASWFATHPPLEERIRRLDTAVAAGLPGDAEAASVGPLAARENLPNERAKAAGISNLAGQRTAQIKAEPLTQTAGTLQPEGLAWSRDLIANLPAPLLEAIREPSEARALMLGLLLHKDPDPRTVQIAAITKAGGEELAVRAAFLAQAAADHNVWRLEIAELCLPALKWLSPQQRTVFLALIRALIQADQRVDLFEYALLKLVELALSPRPSPARQPTLDTSALLPQLRTLLAAQARCAGDQARAAAAFAAGWRAIAPHTPLPAWREDRADLRELDAAIERLRERGAGPLVLRALAHAVTCDGVIRESEFTLLRAVAAGFGCPMPPLIARQAGNSRD